MATYSRSPRLIKEYLSGTSSYSGFGPACCIPTRLRVERFDGHMFLIVVASVKGRRPRTHHLRRVR